MAPTRLDEQIFFIFDHMQLRAESDDLNDAIVFFLPRSTDVGTQCALCGQLMGMVTFFKHMTGASPIEFTLQKCRFALKHFGRFTMAMSEKGTYTGRVANRQLERLHKLFTFYQQSLEDVYEDSGGDFKMFQNFVREIFESYVPYVWRFGDLVAAAFESLPSVEPSKCGTNVLLEASDILQRIQRMPDVFAGCILLHNRVLCSQLDSELTSHLLLIQQQKMEFPCQRIQPAFDLPHDICLLSVYLTEAQMKLLSPFSSRPPRNQEAGADTAFAHSSATVQTKNTVATHRGIARCLTTVQAKPTVSSPRHITREPDFLLSLSPDTTSEEECASTSFQTEALIHNEGMCHSVSDGSRSSTCLRHDRSPVASPEPGVRATDEITTDHQKPGDLPGIGRETIESVVMVTDRDSTDSTVCSLTSTRYLQSPGMDSSLAAITGDCLQLPEEIGNLPYDISYDMGYDKMNLESQPVCQDGQCGNQSGVQRSSDAESTQNDSGVLDDCSPSVNVADYSGNSSSDLDLTSGIAGGCVCNVTAEGHHSGSGVSYRGSLTGTVEGHHSGSGVSYRGSLTGTVEVEKGAHFADDLKTSVGDNPLKSGHSRIEESETSVDIIGQSVLKHEAGQRETETDSEVRTRDVLEHERTLGMREPLVASECPERRNETDCREKLSETTGEKNVETEIEGRKSMSLQAENERSDISVEHKYGSCDNISIAEVRNQDGVRHETTVPVNLENESVHSTRESEDDVEVKNHSDLQLETMHNRERASRRESETDVERQNQTIQKPETAREATEPVGDEIKSELANKSESADVTNLSVQKYGTTVAVDVEPESQHVEAEKKSKDINTEKKSECFVDDKSNDGSKPEETHGTTIVVDVESESANASDADNNTDSKTESEHNRLKSARDEIKDDSQDAQTEDTSVECVECVECGLRDMDEIHKEKDVADICAKSIDSEADICSPVGAATEQSSCVVEATSRIGTCPVGDNVVSPEMSPYDSMTGTEADDSCHADMSLGDTKHAFVAKTDNQNVPTCDTEMTDRRQLTLDDIGYVGETETCHPSVSRGDTSDTLIETGDSHGRDDENWHDTAMQGDIVRPSDARPPQKMVNVDLFVQTNTDLMLLLLMEDGVTSHEEKVTNVWRVVTPQLASLDHSIKQSMKTREQSPEVDESSYNYLTFDTFTDQLSGKIAAPTDLQDPMSTLESQFCETAILLHEELHTSETLKEVTLRNHNTSVYGCSVLGQETFFQLKNTRSSPQTPSEKDISMCIDKEASETLLKNHHIQTT